MVRNKKRHGRESSYQWTSESDTASPPVRQRELDEDEDRERQSDARPSALELAIRELRMDLKRLDLKIDGVRDSSDFKDVKTQIVELHDPIESLEAALSALRVDSRARFEDVEAQLDKVEDDYIAVADQVYNTASRTSAEVMAVAVKVKSDDGRTRSA